MAKKVLRLKITIHLGMKKQIRRIHQSLGITLCQMCKNWILYSEVLGKMGFLHSKRGSQSRRTVVKRN